MQQHHSLESPDDWPGNLAGSSSGAVSAAVPGGVDADVKFYGVTDASRMLTTLLGSLTFREGGKGNATSGPVAFCEVHDHGFLFTVNEAKSLQARAYVKKEHFGRYELAPEHQGSQPAERLQFGINLATLVECLRILGPGGDVARLHLRYRASTACLCLTLQQGIALTECQIHTLDDELPCAPLQLESPQPVRIVLKSDALRDGLSELEHGGDAGQKDRRVAVAVTMNPLQLSLTVCGADMGCEMVYPPESLVKLDVARDVTAEYEKDASRTQQRTAHGPRLLSLTPLLPLQVPLLAPQPRRARAARVDRDLPQAVGARAPQPDGEVRLSRDARPLRLRRVLRLPARRGRRRGVHDDAGRVAAPAFQSLKDGPLVH